MKTRRTILIVGLLTYVVAWFLPVLTFGTTLASGRLPGWEALRLALVPIVPYHGFASSMSWGSVFSVISGLTNLLMVGGAFILLRTTGPAPRFLSVSLAAAAALNTWWYFEGSLRADLLLGYYFWVLSFFIVAVASRRQQRLKPPSGSGVGRGGRGSGEGTNAGWRCVLALRGSALEPR